MLESLLSNWGILSQWGAAGPGGRGSCLWSPWGMGFGGPYMGLLFWIMLGVAAFLLIRWLLRASSSEGGRTGGDALEILGQRLARGEISQEQYRQIKAELHH